MGNRYEGGTGEEEVRPFEILKHIHLLPISNAASSTEQMKQGRIRTRNSKPTAQKPRRKSPQDVIDHTGISIHSFVTTGSGWRRCPPLANDEAADEFIFELIHVLIEHRGQPSSSTDLQKMAWSSSAYLSWRIGRKDEEVSHELGHLSCGGMKTPWHRLQIHHHGLSNGIHSRTGV